jgi:pimeloyl-ACP methyl ester carboxylesterase
MTTTPSDVVQENRTVVAGTAVRCLEAGSGHPVVLFHHSFGSPGWLACQEALAAAHAVYAPDLPGFGQSERPDWARHPRDLAILMGWWLRQLHRGPVAVVGCGFGGWVAAELAVMFPEAFSHLVLVGAAGLLPERGRILDQVLISHSEYVRAAFGTTEAYEAVYSAELPDELLLQWDHNREMTARVSWKPYMYNRGLAPLLPLVPLPTLLVWGEHDRVVPIECAERYQSLLPDACLEVVAGCGHAVDLEQPAVLAELVTRHVAAG